MTVEFRGLSKLLHALNVEIPGKIEDASYRASFRSGILVQGDARKSIAKHQSKGRKYRKNKRRVHVASLPGYAPNADTGNLMRNINIHRRFRAKSRGYITVRSNAPYSSALEFGTSRMEMRPFMRPAIRMNRDKIRKIFVQELRREFR